MGFLRKIVGNIFGQRDQRADQRKNGTVARAKKRGTSTSVSHDTRRDALDPADFARLGAGGRGWDLKTVQLADWHNLISSNVERIRYGEDDKALQVVFKNGALYQYEDVEPEIFAGFLHSHSPGQYVWYVLRAYGYAYAKLSSGEATTAKAPPRYTGEVFGVPEWVEDLQARAGRRATEHGVASPAPPGSPSAKTVPFSEGIPPLPWE